MKQKVMTRAWELKRQNPANQISECLKQAWEEAKNPGMKWYTFNVDNARAQITAYLVALLAHSEDEHDQHKAAILLRALRRPMTADGASLMPGKDVGICKYAVRNAA